MVLQYDKKNQLLFNKKSLLSFTRQWQGPVYVYSKALMQKRIALYQSKIAQALGQKPLIHYAMKANSNAELLKLMKKNKLGIDVVSFGEMKKALAAKIPSSQILFSGVAKTDFEIRSAIQKKVGQLNVESLPELSRIIRIAEKMKKPVKIGLRVNPDVNPDTHPYIATGFQENKFGIEFSQVPQAIEFLQKTKFVQFEGFSLHIGSQLFDFSSVAEAIEKTLELEEKIKNLGQKVSTLDIGGGVGVRYDLDAEEIDEKTLSDYCAVLKAKLGNYQGKIRIEPGRFLVARAGVLLTQVQYVKRNSHKNFLICDTGMNHLMRPALYEAHHRIWPVVKREVDSEVFDIVGPICESSDVLGDERILPTPEEYDFLAILDVGAYGYSMASDYNSFAKPREVFF